MFSPRTVETARVPRGTVWRISQVYWLCLGYMGVWAAFQLSIVPLEGRGALVAFVGVLFLAALVLILRSRHASTHGGYGMGYGDRPIFLLFPIAHLVLVVAGVRLTGAANSPFWIVLFVLLCAMTVLASSQEARRMRWGVGLALFCCTVPVPLSTESVLAWLWDFSTRLLFLMLVSVIAERLRRLSSERDAEIAGLRAEMATIEERGRLSREIHDQVGNTLAASVLRLDVTARTLERQGDAARAVVLREEASDLREAMNHVRDWTFLARPWSSQEEDSPAEVLERETARLARRCGLPVVLSDAQHLNRLSKAARLAALRITQEALANIVKHAKTATTVTVSLWLENGGGNEAICLRITDDGAGFDLATAGDSIGLSSMHERARGAGGDVTMESAKGAGTTVTARFPAA